MHKSFDWGVFRCRWALCPFLKTPRGDYSDTNRTFAHPPFSRRNGILRQILALDRQFVAEISLELETRTTEFSFLPGFQDPTLRSLLILLKREFQASAPVVSMYGESLAHTIAVRFLTLKTWSLRSPETSVCSVLPSQVLKRILERIEDDLSSELLAIARERSRL